MESCIDHLMNSRGWIGFTNKLFVLPYYLEFKNRGPDDVTEGRVTWAFVTSDTNIILNFIVKHFISGDKWITANIPLFLYILKNIKEYCIPTSYCVTLTYFFK